MNINKYNFEKYWKEYKHNNFIKDDSDMKLAYTFYLFGFSHAKIDKHEKKKYGKTEFVS